jgi:predicted Rdx family selenoprotein
VDKLIKVYRKSGKDEWVLVHIEVQGSTDKAFEKRMFKYYYRILDKYDRDITSLAILTDKSKSFHPRMYKKEFIGSSVDFRFNVYKVLDADEKELEKSENPFASVILVVLTALKKGKISENSLFDLKKQLLKKLHAKDFSREKITALLRFLKLYVRFESKELISKFDEELDKITNRPNTMGLKEFVLDRERRMARKEGREEGIEQGMSIKEREDKTYFTKNLIFQSDFSNEKIALIVGVEIEFVKEMRDSLS